MLRGRDSDEAKSAPLKLIPHMLTALSSFISAIRKRLWSEISLGFHISVDVLYPVTYT